MDLITLIYIISSFLFIVIIVFATVSYIIYKRKKKIHNQLDIVQEETSINKEIEHLQSFIVEKNIQPEEKDESPFKKVEISEEKPKKRDIKFN
ncbi:MAG TPA: hypothetical protein PK887_04725 [Ignavibacteriales bacterium]|jgi:hypothetical protein|nr:hypothetical protein [Ignavibacteriales bacterium]